SIRGYLPERRLEALCHGYIRHLSNIIIFLLNEVIEQVTMSDYPEYETHTLVNEFEKDSLFMFPAGGYGYECYFNNLAKQLRSKLVMFNDFHHYLADIANSNINIGVKVETLAQTYIAKMKVLQPKGPYRLFGWSFGGVLAFEIARQLCLQEEVVSHLFLLDSYFNLYSMPSVLGLTDMESLVIGKVNLQYQPGKVNLGSNINVVLFKATQNPSSSWHEVLVTVARHYATKQMLNGLDNILEHPVKLIPLDTDHFEWTKSNNSVYTVSQHIDKFITSTNY
ncbi:MAG: synthetase PcbAB, partial [Burkholderiales bacterium]|nr:synthetase PcbAB [Burkholderiales bacterium]